ncbi:hypothetical protein Taro_043369 [Colocasia esculenta]|uniref:Uncharacterized protein n=1 Tax=Colocasia esculenta TaxID=4460 RepID=A0A843WG88_COLES|nr:hypothetical protein [Colocasia esculenta]
MIKLQNTIRTYRHSSPPHAKPSARTICKPFSICSDPVFSPPQPSRRHSGYSHDGHNVKQQHDGTSKRWADDSVMALEKWDGSSLNDAEKDALVGALGRELRVEGRSSENAFVPAAEQPAERDEATSSRGAPVSEVRGPEATLASVAAELVAGEVAPSVERAPGAAGEDAVSNEDCVTGSTSAVRGGRVRLLGSVGCQTLLARSVALGDGEEVSEGRQLLDPERPLKETIASALDEGTGGRGDVEVRNAERFGLEPLDVVPECFAFYPRLLSMSSRQEALRAAGVGKATLRSVATCSQRHDASRSEPQHVFKEPQPSRMHRGSARPGGGVVAIFCWVLASSACPRCRESGRSRRNVGRSLHNAFFAKHCCNHELLLFFSFFFSFFYFFFPWRRCSTPLDADAFFPLSLLLWMQMPLVGGAIVGRNGWQSWRLQWNAGEVKPPRSDGASCPSTPVSGAPKGPGATGGATSPAVPAAPEGREIIFETTPPAALFRHLLGGYGNSGSMYIAGYSGEGDDGVDRGDSIAGVRTRLPRPGRPATKVLVKVLEKWDGSSLNDAEKGAPVGALGGELRVEVPVEGPCS